MKDYPSIDLQGSVNKQPAPNPRKVVDPKRPWYPSTPSNDHHTPDSPVATTTYPTKPKPSGAA